MVGGEAAFRDRILAAFRTLKERGGPAIPVSHGGNTVAWLRPLSCQFTASEVALLVAWRNRHREAFLTWAPVTEASTRRWVTEQILARADRVLFLVETADGIPFGQMGLANVDFAARAVEVDNVLRGRADLLRGGMSLALRALLDWLFFDLGGEVAYLRVLADNRRALDFYTRNGFRFLKKVPLKRVSAENGIRWVELTEDVTEAERYLLYLAIHRDGYRQNTLEIQGAQ